MAVFLYISLSGVRFVLYMADLAHLTLKRIFYAVADFVHLTLRRTVCAVLTPTFPLGNGLGTSLPQHYIIVTTMAQTTELLTFVS